MTHLWKRFRQDDSAGLTQPERENARSPEAATKPTLNTSAEALETRVYNKLVRVAPQTCCLEQVYLEPLTDCLHMITDDPEGVSGC